jgi:magnesium transporter
MDKLNPATLFVPEIRELLKSRSLSDLKALLSEINPIDLADAFHEFAPEEQVFLLRLMASRQALIVFEELEILQQEYVLHHIGDEHLQGWVGDVSPEILRRMIRKLPSLTLKKMEKHLRQGQLEVARPERSYPPEAVGSMMQTVFVTLVPTMTVREAQEHLRAKLRIRHEQNMPAIYVSDDKGVPVGSVTPRTLLAAPLDSRLVEIMTPTGVIRIVATADREEASRLFSRYRLLSAPVVDEENRLVGTLSADDMMQVLQEEDTEDIHKLGALEALPEPYFKISFMRMIRRRGMWLCVLFIGEMLTATAMAFFEKEIARAVVLALFIPLIISSGGNSGSQAATLIVRAMALREITFGDWWRVMRRELAAGLTLGIILGSLGFMRIYLWSLFSPIYGPHSLLVALTVGCALILVVLWGSLSGSLLPIALRRLGLDPAVVSAPFVATLVDVTGLVIYFVTGMLILRGTLL